jgi:diaminopimelate epimerase
MSLRFSKYEGLGNDFLIVEDRSVDPALAVALCDRHRGVGADGVILLGEQAGGPSMRVINADGSTPEMCGNGLRCVARHLVRRGTFAERQSFSVHTDAGPHGCSVAEGEVTVHMRPASFVPADVPVVADAPLLDAPLELDDVTLRITAVSMGNPHAVTFDDVGAQRLVLGPRVQGDRRFPRGVNVGFARDAADGAIDLFVLERGAGWTEACGTGACAAVAAAVATGRRRAGDAVTVRLPGGSLGIVVSAPEESILMTGPARHVFDGAVVEEIIPRRDA